MITWLIHYFLQEIYVRCVQWSLFILEIHLFECRDMFCNLILYPYILCMSCLRLEINKETNRIKNWSKNSLIHVVVRLAF